MNRQVQIFVPPGTKICVDLQHWTRLEAMNHAVCERFFLPILIFDRPKLLRGVTFRFIKAEPGKLYFDGLTYERKDDLLRFWVVTKKKDGSLGELEFTYKRRAPARVSSP